MNTIVDGKTLAEELKRGLAEEVKALQKSLCLAVVFIGDNPASESFIKRKQKFGKEIGIAVKIFKPSEDIYTNRSKLRSYLAEIVHNKTNTGVIIQLPFPDELSSRTQYFLDSIISEKDVDVLSSHAIGKFVTRQSIIEPPLVGVVKMIFEKYSIELRGKNIVVVGASGALVGKPISLWFLSERIPFIAINSKTPQEQFREMVSKADVIISGVGKAGLITADMVKDGVIALDAGTSATSGQLKGDLEREIAKKASLFTPVPGGIGPLTVVMLFKNLITLAKEK